MAKQRKQIDWRLTESQKELAAEYYPDVQQYVKGAVKRKHIRPDQHDDLLDHLNEYYCKYIVGLWNESKSPTKDFRTYLLQRLKWGLCDFARVTTINANRRNKLLARADDSMLIAKSKTNYDYKKIRDWLTNCGFLDADAVRDHYLDEKNYKEIGKRKQLTGERVGQRARRCLYFLRLALETMDYELEFSV